MNTMIDLTKTATGTRIMQPWGGKDNQKPVTFLSIERTLDDEDGDGFTIRYEDEHGKRWMVLSDNQFATSA